MHSDSGSHPGNHTQAELPDRGKVLFLHLSLLVGLCRSGGVVQNDVS